MKTITAAMIPLPMALRGHREREGEVLPLVLLPQWPPPGRGEVLPLDLGLHGDDGPSGSFPMASGDDGPLRQGAGEGLD